MLVLILMVRNESRILERCLKAVENVVDAFCIHDTGSTDNTCEIANTWLETHKGCLTTSEWKNFGHNRTQSFLAAKEFVEKQGWTDAYGLLLDADMEFVPGTLKNETLTETGYSLYQVAGHLEYPNCRLVKMSYNWVCRGVTHEYWDGPTKVLPKSIAYIDDKNDGGCKADKFERDIRLLEQGLLDEPTNARYLFYLAQSYHSLGEYKKAIQTYKKRIAAGGWWEEIWYSHFMIGNSYLSLEDPIKFEAWMLRAFKLNPHRAEPLYKLARHFREKSEHIKAWYYVQKGRSLPKPNDVLFLETPVYSGLFDYEATILLYYLDKKREGLRESMKYLMTKTDHLDNVYKNLSFYIEPIATNIRNHPVPRHSAGWDYHPTSTSIIGPNAHNVRFVNYDIDQKTGSYMMKEGCYSANHKVRTQNVYWDGKTAKLMKVVPSLPSKDTNILGLEDLRVYRGVHDNLEFLAASREFSDKIRVLHGTYDIERGECRDLVVIESPRDAECEKNWIPIDGTPDIIYNWQPLTIGHIKGNAFCEDRTFKTPWIFRHIRGSAVPIRVKDELWVLTHVVEYSAPRKYFHLFVALDAMSYRPKAVTLPFVFANQGIEYCLGTRLDNENIEVVYSSWDDSPCIADIPIASLEWVQV